MLDKRPVWVASSNENYRETNKTNDFRQRLPEPLRFEGEYLCALQSISYPVSWHSVGAYDTQFLKVFFNPKQGLFKTGVVIPLDKFEFPDVKSVVDYMNSQFASSHKTFAAHVALDAIEKIKAQIAKDKVDQEKLARLMKERNQIIRDLVESKKKATGDVPEMGYSADPKPGMEGFVKDYIEPKSKIQKRAATDEPESVEPKKIKKVVPLGKEKVVRWGDESEPTEKPAEKVPIVLGETPYSYNEGHFVIEKKVVEKRDFELAKKDSVHDEMWHGKMWNAPTTIEKPKDLPNTRTEDTQTESSDAPSTKPLVPLAKEKVVRDPESPEPEREVHEDPLVTVREYEFTPDPHHEHKRAIDEIRFGERKSVPDKPEFDLEDELLPLEKPYRSLDTDITQLPQYVDNTDFYKKNAGHLRKTAEVLKNSLLHVSEDADHRLMIKFDKNLISHIELSDEIAQVMGFRDKTPIYHLDKAEKMPDLHAGVHGFIVYERSGLIGTSIFGDVLDSVLAHITVRGKPGQVIEERFNPLTWVPVQAREIDELKFEIKTQFQKKMPFQWGSIFMTLVFKRALDL